MPASRKDPPNWGKKAVVDRLKSAPQDAGRVKASIFLKGSVAAADVGGVARKLVAAAEAEGQPGAPAAEIGAASSLARSFSLTASPDTVERIANMPEVHAILPSETSDAHPKPVKVKPVVLGKRGPKPR